MTSTVVSLPFSNDPTTTSSRALQNHPPHFKQAELVVMRDLIAVVVALLTSVVLVVSWLTSSESHSIFLRRPS